MKNFKALRFITFLLLLFLLTVWAVPQQQKKDIQTKTEKKESVVQEKTQEKKEKEDKAKPDDFEKALGERMASGESLFKALGLPEPEDYMPTTFEIFLFPFCLECLKTAMMPGTSARIHSLKPTGLSALTMEGQNFPLGYIKSVITRQ